jgi:predicted membrane protein
MGNLLLKDYWTSYLRIIGSSILSCMLIMVFLSAHSKVLTRIESIYFFTETLIITLLAYIELRVANRLKNKKSD